MRDTLRIECFVEALDQYMEAAAAEREARSKYEGYSWGYHGAYYIDRKADAAAALEDTLLMVVAPPQSTGGE